jgi:peptidoglycan glycosyltransferase
MLLALTITKFIIIALLAGYLIRRLAVSISELGPVFSFVKRKEMSVLVWGFVLVFATMVFYQSYWQLLISNEHFEETKKLHDPRPWIIEATTLKGTIYDHNHDPEKVFASYKQGKQGQLPRRHYPLGEATSHIIGYSDVERDKAGLEKIYFERLMGRTDTTPEEKENLTNNRYYRLRPVGNDIVLTLDYDLQKAAYEAFGDNKGAVVAIQPQTGALIVLVSAPSFHPDSVSVDAAWVRIVKDNDGRRLYNRALKGRYPPGSTFKAMVAAAALENEIDPLWNIGRDGYRPPGVQRKRVFDHERAAYAGRGQTWGGHGRMDMTKALVKSSNAYFAQLGVTVGDSAMHAIVERFGYDQPVLWNTSNPALAEGLVTFRSSFPPTANAHELAWSSIGQEKVLATPLQLAMTAAAIANDGVLMRPMLEVREEPQVWNRVVSAETARKVRKMMREVVWAQGGTAWRLRMNELEIGGKTGTAELTEVEKLPDGTVQKRMVNNAVFISFAPVDNPQLAVAVVAEGAGYGGSTAAPIAKEIYQKALEIGFFEESESTNGESAN